jgi:hypothetical protein
MYEQLDRARRAQGQLLDAAGLGPQETRYREVFREPGVALRRYGGEAQAGPLVLVVPAPIKRPYIWDLAPQVSAVRRCLDGGARVLLADWQPPPPGFGLAEYADRLILDCLDAARAERAVLLGHSLGGPVRGDLRGASSWAGAGARPARRAARFRRRSAGVRVDGGAARGRRSARRAARLFPRLGEP